MKNESAKQAQNKALRKTDISRSVTPYDYGYTDVHKWNSGNACKSAYRKALKLTDTQKQKFEILNDNIGSVVNFIIGKKVYKTTIVAVALPDETVTVYPTGEMHDSGNEFVRKYRSYPYEFRLAIEGRMDFWSARIDNIDMSYFLQMPKTHLKYKDFDSMPDNYM